MQYRLAVDVGATRTMLALIRRDAPKVVAHKRPITNVLFRSRESVGLALADAIQRLLYESGVNISSILGVGIGVPGVVDGDTGTVVNCPNLSMLNGATLAQDVSQQLDIPVYLDNNTNLISVGEHTAGVGRGVNDMAVVFVGSGVGCGIILDGKVYKGADGAAAEFGHTKVVPNGLLCTCQGHGCLEMYCSGKALALLAEEVFGPREMYHLGTRFGGARLLIEQAKAGNKEALQALQQAFFYLGLALSNLVNLLNPRLIVLGGGIVFAWPQGVDIATEIVTREALPATRRDLRIEMSELKNFAGVLGGAAMVSAQRRA